jgi:hypothetical protein
MERRSYMVTWLHRYMGTLTLPSRETGEGVRAGDPSFARSFGGRARCRTEWKCGCTG